MDLLAGLSFVATFDLGGYGCSSARPIRLR